MSKPNINQIPQTTDNNVWRKEVRMDSDPVELVRSIAKKHYAKLTNPKKIWVRRWDENTEIVCIIVEYFDGIVIKRAFSFTTIRQAVYLEGIIAHELAELDLEHDMWEETRYG